MQLWIKKISAILIAILTLGLYIPPTFLDTSTDADELVSEEKGTKINEIVSNEDIVEGENSQARSEDPLSHYKNDQSIDIINEQIKELTTSKLGPRIMNQVEEDFTQSILPKIEEVVTSILAEAGKEGSSYYGITENPSSGYGERIFNLYDYRIETEVAKFHVRRDNRPGEGYWFNFHYHLSKDGFVEHHTVGEIYWDKNTPPKWMA